MTRVIKLGLQQMSSTDFNWGKFLENGDEHSFSNIYNSHVDNLYSYGLSLGCQKDMCKDAIQDVFYKLYISREDLRSVKNLTAYLFKSFKHRLIDLSRKKAREENMDSVLDSFSIQVTVLDDIIDIENAEILKKKVAKLLDELTPSQREVVYLKYMIGLEYKVIANILDIREDSTRRLLFRAIGKLRQHISDIDFNESLGLLAMLFISQHFL